jgi:hypothetical protein
MINERGRREKMNARKYTKKKARKTNCFTRF